MIHDAVFLDDEENADWIKACGRATDRRRLQHLAALTPDERSAIATRAWDTRGRGRKAEAPAPPSRRFWSQVQSRKATDRSITHYPPVIFKDDERRQFMATMSDRSTEMHVAMDEQGHVLAIRSSGKESETEEAYPDVPPYAKDSVAMTLHNHPNGFAYPSDSDYQIDSLAGSGKGQRRLLQSSTIARDHDGHVVEVILQPPQGQDWAPYEQVKAVMRDAIATAMVGIRQRWAAGETFREGQAVEETVRAGWEAVVKAGLVRMTVTRHD